MSTEENKTQSSGVESLQKIYDSNKKNINLAMIVLVAIAAGAWYYVRMYKPGLEKDAQESFFMAERYFQMDSLSLALNGDGINSGMIDLADEYGSTKVGSLAAYYAARIYMKQGDFESALDYLNDVSFSDEIMSAQIVTLKGDCQSELGDYSAAADHYMDAASKRDNGVSTPYALRKAGEAYEEAGEYSDALEAYSQIQEDYPTARDARSIDVMIARVEAKIAASK